MSMERARADLPALLERVKAATQADRELDAALFNALVDDSGRIAFKVSNWSVEPGSRLDRYHDGWLYGKGETDKYADNLPRYSASTDAALELVERLLPGWFVLFNTGSVAPGAGSKVDTRPRAELAEPIETKFGSGVGIRAQVHGATPALAILAALLSALISQQGSPQ